MGHPSMDRFQDQVRPREDEQEEDNDDSDDGSSDDSAPLPPPPPPCSGAGAAKKKAPPKKLAFVLATGRTPVRSRARTPTALTRTR